jgi:putative hydrolase of the HAD superfamily
MLPFPQAIFFDAVGTLFHLREPVGETYADIAAQHGVVADAATLETGFRAAWKSLPVPVHEEGMAAEDDDRSWWEELVRRTFQHALPQMPDESKMTTVFDDLYEHYAYAGAWQLWDDTVPVLENLHATDCRLLVLSNFDKRLRNILEGLEIAHYFEAIIVSSEVGAWKPDPRMFRAALMAAHAQPEECLHIGDDPRADGEGATAMGIPSLLVKRPEVTLRVVLEKMGMP